MVEHLSLSIEIGYNLVMDFFKNKENKRRFNENYYKSIKIPITPPYSHIQTQNEGEDEGFERGEKEPDGGDESCQESDFTKKEAYIVCTFVHL